MPNEIKGEQFVGTMSQEEQVRLDTETVKSMLTPAQIIEASRTIRFAKISTKRLDITKKAKFKLPANMENFTPQGLIDMLGDAREKAAILKKEEKLYKEMLAQHFGIEVTEDKEGEDGEAA